MGMFDTDLGKPWTDHFKEGDAFTLTRAARGPMIPTEFGESRPALLTIDGETYSIFGQGIVSQVEQMEDGDLPAEVKIVRKKSKDGKREVKLIVPAGQDTQDDIPF